MELNVETLKSVLLRDQELSDNEIVELRDCTSADSCCNGYLEIKCPYSIAGSVTIALSPDEISDRFDKKFFMRRGEDGSFALRIHTMPKCKGRWHS